MVKAHWKQEEIEILKIRKIWSEFEFTDFDNLASQKQTKRQIELKLGAHLLPSTSNAALTAFWAAGVSSTFGKQKTDIRVESNPEKRLGTS